MTLANASKTKSTTVRIPRGLPTAMRALGSISPALAARWAESLFRTPPRHADSDLDRELVASGRAGSLAVFGTSVPVWTWGSGSPVLLVHGWGSRGTRLGSFVAPLVAAGHRVVAFDAPGHGAAPGRRSSLPEFVFAVEAAAKLFGEFAAVVAHSLGGAATTLAIARGTRARRVVFLAPAADPAGYTRFFAGLVGLSDAMRRRMEDRLVARFGMSWPEFDVLRAARSIRTPLLVIHDAADAEVPYSDGERIASTWPGARIVATSGLGHKRIVHDPSVVEASLEFLTARKPHRVASA